MNYIKTTYQNHKYTNYPDELIFYLLKKYYFPNNNCYENKALDIGCGRGEFSRTLNKYFDQVVSLDKIYSDNFHKDLDWYNCDLEHGLDLLYGPYTEQKYDLIFMKSVLEHIWNPENLLITLKQVMKPSSLIINLIPNYNNQKNIFYDDPTHVHPYNFKSMHDLFDMYGFKIIENCEFYQLPIIWKYPILKLFAKTIQLFVKPEHYFKNKYIKWATETMILTIGEKQ